MFDLRGPGKVSPQAALLLTKANKVINQMKDYNKRLRMKIKEQDYQHNLTQLLRKEYNGQYKHYR